MGRGLQVDLEMCIIDNVLLFWTSNSSFPVTGDQVKNHLKKWRKIWGKVVNLKNLSGALWDEDTCTIGSVRSTIQGITHKVDAPFLNTPIEHYYALASIYGTIGAKGLGARSVNNLLSIDIEDEENAEVKTSPNVGESSDPKAPPKNKVKVKNIVDDPLVITLKDGFQTYDDDIPDDLWDVVSVLPDFDEERLAHYHAHLVDNPKIARAFMKLTQINKCVRVSRYVKKNF
ncbi:hypothetical protein ZWY2020_011136 [Hordeum vulgare]|nr:hypothetical protein ZWY2020_011136 [Hordeum vulgare]